MTLPAKVSATLADDGPDGRIYHLRDDRGYTKSRDTIRVGDGGAALGAAYSSAAMRYTIHVWRKEGWVLLLNGYRPRGDDLMPYDKAIERAAAVLYGMEDHG